MRARGFRPCVRTASSLAISSAADASEICDDTAAVSRPPSTSVRSDRILSRSGSRGPSSCSTPASGTISRSKRPSARAAERALVRLDRERLHVVARDVPLLGDHLGAAELRDLLRAVARFPARRARERVVEPVLLAREHRRADRDRAHVLHAARDDEVARARHHRLGGEVHRLLRRPALAVDRRARHFVGVARRRASTCARCRPPAARSCRRSRTRRRRPRRGRRRRARCSARIECAPRSAGWTWARPPLRRPTGERTASTMNALSGIARAASV